MLQTLHPVIQAALAPFVMPRSSLEERRAIADIANNVDKAQRAEDAKFVSAMEMQIQRANIGEFK
jgi:hypothetical protein